MQIVKKRLFGEICESLKEWKICERVRGWKNRYGQIFKKKKNKLPSDVFNKLFNAIQKNDEEVVGEIFE